MGSNAANVLHTGFYTKKAEEFFEGMIEPMQVYGSVILNNQLEKVKVERAADGEVLLVEHDEYGYGAARYQNYVWKKPKAEACRWLAINLKHFVQQAKVDFTNLQSRSDRWSRSSIASFQPMCDRTRHNKTTNSFSSEWSVNVRDVYLIYEILSGRSREKIIRNYGSDVVDAWIGMPRDPITTELEVARREEQKRLEHERDAEITKAAQEQEKADAIAREEYYRKSNENEKVFEAKKAEITKKYQKLFAGLYEKFLLDPSESDTPADEKHHLCTSASFFG